MSCPNCNTTLDQGAKFCTSCGHRLAAAEEVSATSDSAATTTINHQQYLDQGKKISKQYVTFAKQSLRNPFSSATSLNSTNMINAIISIVLYAFLLPLFLYNALSKMSMGFYSPSFGEIVIVPMFVSMIILIGITGIIFAVSKLMKVQIGFLDVLTRFGSLLTIPAAVLILANVFAVLSVMSFGVMLLVVSLISYFVAIAATIMSLPSQPGIGIDKFYGILITYLVMLIVTYMFGESIVSDFIAELTSFGSLF
ncbi:zinc ribbon domain-containing protein [Alkalihalophilus pseudofirmus]|uniref:zinc ribbon domain-containing protein n=1 Tax=Alkalihalophilus pseudofirmus TaxID=79885 RepID=UPI00259AF927|nr:zinc ribbon domain-containing protein [Alkalihalophilus pseudofirmus]WEG16736.1 zinc ribbon domain-containing protein [Alkalihalophilus pseudofirmus]